MTGMAEELGYEVSRSRSILGMRVDATSYEDATRQIISWARSSPSRYVCVAAVSDVVEAHDDAGFMQVINQAIWLRRSDAARRTSIAGVDRATRVYGAGLPQWVTRGVEREGVGGVLWRRAGRILCHGAEVAAGSRVRSTYGYSPPYRELTSQEDGKIVEAIDASGAKGPLHRPRLSEAGDVDGGPSSAGTRRHGGR